MRAVPFNQKRVVKVAVVVLLLFHASLLGWMAWRRSPAIDEPGHLVAGLSHWQVGGFDLYRVNPPLVRLLATFPLLGLDLRPDWSLYTNDPYGRPEFSMGAALADANGAQSFLYFTLARWACIPFSIVGGWICYRWANELYGAASGITALLLWCFCPNILGNAALITPDAGAAALGVTAGFCFWRWLRRPSWKRACLAGLTLGLAELTKSTWIVLFGLWPLLWLTWNFASKRAGDTSLLLTGRVLQTDAHCPEYADAPGNSRSLPSLFVFRHATGVPQLAFILLVGLYILNLGYGFENSCQRLREFQFISRAMGGPDAHVTPGNRFVEGWRGALPVPVPANYLAGIDLQRYDFEKGNWSYLRGEQKKGGWWYYYLYAMAVKVPAGVLFLFGVVLAQRVVRSLRFLNETPLNFASRPDELNRPHFTLPSPSQAWLDDLTVLAPAIIILVLVSSQTGFNRYLRYVLPLFPFLFVWTSQAVTLWFPRSRSKHGNVCRMISMIPRILVPFALIASIASSLAVFPHSLSYFNEIVGGPINGPAHLLDANVDWCQDLLELRRWHDAHREARPLFFAYFGNINPHTAGLDCRSVTRPPAPANNLSSMTPGHGWSPGWYAISVNHLHGYKHYGDEEDCYQFLRTMRPDARAGYSIVIHQVGLKADRQAMTLRPSPRDGSRMPNAE